MAQGYGKAEWEQLLQIDPREHGDEDLARLFSTGVTLYELEEYLDSARIFYYLTQFGPKVSNYWNGLGSALQGIDRLDEAVEAFDRAILSDPLELANYVNAARCCIASQRCEDAIEYLEAGLEYGDSTGSEEFYRETEEELVAVKIYTRTRGSED
jgi:tetratricopeptide (TPR) repeat protein